MRNDYCNVDLDSDTPSACRLCSLALCPAALPPSILMLPRTADHQSDVVRGVLDQPALLGRGLQAMQCSGERWPTMDCVIAI